MTFLLKEKKKKEKKEGGKEEGKKERKIDRSLETDQGRRGSMMLPPDEVPSSYSGA